jgi:hypothetical protein
MSTQNLPQNLIARNGQTANSQQSPLIDNRIDLAHWLAEVGRRLGGEK